MQLKDIGEFGLIDRIKDNTIATPDNVVLGIGDDAGVYLPGQRQLGLVTADMLVEGVHFLLGKTTAWQLGYKAMAVNMSDIAAMGGAPRHAVVSIGLPNKLPPQFVVDMYTGMKEICHEFGVNIIGGDTVASPHGLVVNVTVIGEVEPARLLKRSGARPGDLLAVTGTLGNSACGLDFLLSADWEEQADAWPLVTAHLTPRPQLAAGRELAGWGATSADDVSDGLASEANEIAKASKVGVRLFADRIPFSPELVRAAPLFNKSPLEYALYGGEDFQLVFTISPADYANLPQGALAFTAVGEITRPEDGVVIVGGDGCAARLEPRGYNHFR